MQGSPSGALDELRQSNALRCLGIEADEPELARHCRDERGDLLHAAPHDAEVDEAAARIPSQRAIRPDPIIHLIVGQVREIRVLHSNGCDETRDRCCRRISVAVLLLSVQALELGRRCGVAFGNRLLLDRQVVAH
jgi:hypothetical protein